ncbi:jg15667 [Pararge aegeria aegeria]|uniref:Jg15667 protein n=1 Tax=Pararge aegeria aegeria TaxID=348720 RepID=A0A8S4S0P0_9NEOP|nr:jg15667 [Pararge aegeria aegeria]
MFPRFVSFPPEILSTPVPLKGRRRLGAISIVVLFMRGTTRGSSRDAIMTVVSRCLPPLQLRNRHAIPWLRSRMFDLSPKNYNSYVLKQLKPLLPSPRPQ